MNKYELYSGTLPGKGNSAEQRLMESIIAKMKFLEKYGQLFLYSLMTGWKTDFSTRAGFDENAPRQNNFTSFTEDGSPQSIGLMKK